MDQTRTVHGDSSNVRAAAAAAAAAVLSIYSWDCRKFVGKSHAQLHRDEVWFDVYVQL
jgi:hypothetical protein